jgi:hypothetical protein
MPITGTVLIVALGIAGAWYGGRALVHGAKKAEHKVVAIFHKKKS